MIYINFSPSYFLHESSSIVVGLCDSESRKSMSQHNRNRWTRICTYVRTIITCSPPSILFKSTLLYPYLLPVHLPYIPTHLSIRPFPGLDYIFHIYRYAYICKTSKTPPLSSLSNRLPTRMSH